MNSSDSRRFEPYVPLFRNPHLATIIGRYLPPRFDSARWRGGEEFFDTEPGVKVLGQWNWCGPGGGRPIVVAIHGLAASSDAPYMRALAQAALEQGFDVLRLNVRNCGGTEHLAPTLYHSGLTGDLRAVVEQLSPAPLFLVGFSMGGNMALKLAGEWGDEAPAHVRAVCGVSVPFRLDVCSKRLGRTFNRVYEIRFLRMLRHTMARKRQLMPELFAGLPVSGARTIWEFDETITAPAFGFRGAQHYYDTASAAWYLGDIRVPTLLIQAKDDPFIPFGVYDLPAFEENPLLELLAPAHGGHVAFPARRGPRFWAIAQSLNFFLEAGGETPDYPPAARSVCR
jgi:predicted alpha/beta-fold hydrolase